MSDLSRTTTAYVSGYDRTRMQLSRLVRGEKRQLLANFNGIIPPGFTIISATWRTTQNWAANMSDAVIAEDGRSTSVTLVAGWGGPALVKVEVQAGHPTGDQDDNGPVADGGVYNQVFRIDVQTAPYFQGEANPVSGPTSLTVAL